MNKKNAGAVFGTLCGLTALTAMSAEIFYDFSINTKSPIHMSKLNNLVQKVTNTSGSEEDASEKYSGLTGTPEMKNGTMSTVRMFTLCPTLFVCTARYLKTTVQNMYLSATDTQARPSIWPVL